MQQASKRKQPYPGSQQKRSANPIPCSPSAQTSSSSLTKRTAHNMQSFRKTCAKHCPMQPLLALQVRHLLKVQSGKRRAKKFGDYVSQYNFGRSIADGTTVPLYYE